MDYKNKNIKKTKYSKRYEIKNQFIRYLLYKIYSIESLVIQAFRLLIFSFVFLLSRFAN